MVTLIIEPKPFPETIKTHTRPPELREIQCRGEVPAHLFERLVDSGAEWYLDLTHANDEEATNWAFEDIYAQCLKAFKEGKTVTLVGVVVNEEEIYDELWRFMEECQEVPSLESVNNTLIEVGSPCVETEQFWPELMD